MRSGADYIFSILAYHNWKPPPKNQTLINVFSIVYISLKSTPNANWSGDTQEHLLKLILPNFSCTKHVKNYSRLDS